jgi:hypothetical protein
MEANEIQTLGLLVIAVITSITAVVNGVLYVNAKKAAKEANDLADKLRDDVEEFKREQDEKFKKQVTKIMDEYNALAQSTEEINKEKEDKLISFHETREEYLNKRIKEATDVNRKLALEISRRVHNDSDAIVKTAKLFHRFLQGKE